MAVGTQFDVYRKDERNLAVTVMEGKVRVERHGAAPILLTAGQRLSVGNESGSAISEKVDVRAETAWLHREIVFDGRRLADVAAEFNRYIPIPIAIEDPHLQDLEVSGVFNAYDTDSFLSFLAQYDVHVERDGAGIKITK